MLTYQIQTRTLKIENGVPFEFPGTAIIDIEFEPASTFGAEDSLGRMIVRGRKAKVFFNANTGRMVAKSTPPLEPIEVIFRDETKGENQVEFRGNVLRITAECQSLEELHGIISGFQWVLPTLLNLEFRDPPIVKRIAGSVGNTKFAWEHHPNEWFIQLYPVTSDQLEEHAAWSLDTLREVHPTKDRRLLAALSYFHTASRLLATGTSPWEFMAEVILNFAKCLEILFIESSNTSRDDVRKALASLEFTKEEIEGDFTPILLLRNEIDVAHPRVALFRRDDLSVLYRYLANTENNFRRMLLRLVEAAKSGKYKLRQSDDLSLSPVDQKGMDQLVKTMRTRITIQTDNTSQ